MTSKIVVTWHEAEGYLLCKDAVLRYWNSGCDSKALDRYMPNRDKGLVFLLLQRLFEELADIYTGGYTEGVVSVPQTLQTVRWVMYRYVFDREYDGLYSGERNEALLKMGLPFYTMFYGLAEKMSRVDRNTVRIVY